MAVSLLVCGFHLGFGAWFTFRELDPHSGDSWTSGELVGVLVVWAVGLLLIGRLVETSGPWSAALVSRAVAASMLVGAVASMIGGRVRTEFGLNFSGGIGYAAGTFAYAVVMSAVFVGLPMLLFVKGSPERRKRAAVAATIAAALLAPAVFANEFHRKPLLILGVVAVVIVVPVLIVGLLVRSERRPGAVVWAALFVMVLGYGVLLVPIISLAAESGHEDAVYSQPWLTLAGLSAQWYALSVVTTSEPLGSGSPGA
ncbi:MAG: hypothetical protein OEU32_16345 [Acidimicrobiia bacterium]|nr:hypothetical protein [Acidimicrobiia bacterium]